MLVSKKSINTTKNTKGTQQVLILRFLEKEKEKENLVLTPGTEWQVERPVSRGHLSHGLLVGFEHEI